MKNPPARGRAQKRFRILHVIHGLSRGGLENGVINLVNHLPQEEFEQAICCLDQRGEMAARITGNVPIFVLDRGRHDLRLPLRLANLLRQQGPDVIHCRNWNTWLDAAAAHLLTLRRSSLVWSFHGFADGDWFPLRRRMASRALAMITDRLFAVCRDSADRYASRAGIPSERFEVIYNGVDTLRFAPAPNRSQLRAELGIKDEELVVVTVASLTPVKDHASLILAIAGLPIANETLVRFLFLGEGPLRQQLESQVAELGLQRRVFLPGNCDRVADFLAAADFLVLPSRLEGMSNAILEAMASGLPVIARCVGGNPELVVQGETGLLCRPDDIADLSAAIGRLIHDGALRYRMGKAARQRAEKVFSIEAMTTAYAEFYRRAARASRAFT